MNGPLPPQVELNAQFDALRRVGKIAGRPERGWLRGVRTALGLSQTHVSAKASMSRQAYADLEGAEERGAISLNSLRRAAAAMDCELLYFVVHRETDGAARGKPVEGQGQGITQPKAIESSKSHEARDNTELPVELR